MSKTVVILGMQTTLNGPISNAQQPLPSFLQSRVLGVENVLSTLVILQ